MVHNRIVTMVFAIIIIPYHIYLFRFGCKLNSLFLEDLFIQKVYIGRWLRRSYFRSHRFISYSYFVTSIYYCRIYTQHNTVCKNVRILSLLSMELGSWTEDDRNFVLATWRVGCDWLAGTLNRAVFGLCTLQSNLRAVHTGSFLAKFGTHESELKNSRTRVKPKSRRDSACWNEAVRVSLTRECPWRQLLLRLTQEKMCALIKV